MTTRAELRGALRLRLEDTGAGPLWDDAVLNEAVTSAVWAYGAAMPKEVVVSVVVGAGARRVVVPVAPGAAIDPSRVVRLLDPAGMVVPRGADDEPGATSFATTAAQSWRWWDGAVVFAGPAVAGTWQLELLASRTAPTDDVAAVDLLPGDEAVVLALAEAAVLERRAVEDGKRGSGGGGLAALAAMARTEARRRLAARRRRVRGGWLA